MSVPNFGIFEAFFGKKTASWVKRKEKIIGLNLYNNNLFAIDKQKYDSLISKKCNLEQLKADEPVLFSTMYKLGVIEDRWMDIPSILLMRNRQQVFSNKNYRLIIIPTLNCNFSCWYCYETHTKKKMNKEVLESIVKLIENLIKEEKIASLHLDFFGGEPLLCFDTILKPVCIAAKKLCSENNINFHVSMTTNAFFITEKMIPFFIEHNVTGFQITLDCNKENHDKIRFYGKNKNGSYDTIVKNINLLAETRKINVMLRINYTKSSMDSCTEIINHIPAVIRKEIQIALAQIWQDRSEKTDFDRKSLLKRENKIYNIFKKYNFKVRTSQFLGNVQHTCYADLHNSAVINYDGRVFKCTTPDFEKAIEEGILTSDGNIIWNEELVMKRLARATFDNKICLKCSLLPICSGGCSTNPAFTKMRNNTCTFKPKLQQNIMSLMQQFDKTGYNYCHVSKIQNMLQ